jgi:hypothetical protein
MTNTTIFVKHPSGQIRRFTSVRAVARMLSGTGKASGGLRGQINIKGLIGLAKGFNKAVVRNNAVAG